MRPAGAERGRVGSDAGPVLARSPRDPSIEAITSEAVTARLSRRLRQLIGPGRRWSYGEVARRTGIDVRTIKAYAQGTACPNLVKYKRLVAVLGPEPTVDLDLFHGWQPRADAIPPEAVDLKRLRAELERAARILEKALLRPP